MSSNRNNIDWTDYYTKDGEEASVKDIIRESRFRNLANHLSVAASLVTGEYVVGQVDETLTGKAAATSLELADPYKYAGGRNSPWGKRLRDKYRMTFSPEYLGGNLALWLGATWHEAAHVLWSPYGAGFPITLGLNLLEDARIEMLMAKKHPKTTPAIRAMVRHLLGAGNGVADQSYQGKGIAGPSERPAYSYAWAVGRIHVTKKVKKLLRKAVVSAPPFPVSKGWDGHRVADTIDRIFSEYLSMGKNLDLPRARRLAEELDNLLEDNGVSTTDHTRTQCVSSHVSSGKGTKGTNQPDVDIDEGDIAEALEGSGGSGGDDSDPTLGNLKDAIQESREEADSDSDLRAEVSKLEDIIGGSMPATVVDSGYVPVAPSTKQLAEQVRRIAASFNDESGKGLVRKRDSGRFKPMRFDIYDDLDTAYDQWEPGLDQEMYVHILMDISGSMDRQPVNEIVYALDRGLRDVAEVEVTYFETKFSKSKHRNTESMMVRMGMSGGTQPADGIAYAHGATERASQQNKLLVLLTDGGFDNYSDYHIANAYLKDLHTKGVTVRVIGLGDYMRMDQLRGAVHFLDQDKDVTVMRRLDELPGIVLDWTKTVLR